MRNEPILIRTICLLSVVHCVLLNSCGNNTTQKTTEIKSAGESLYENNCTACHGSDGKLCALGAKDLSISTIDKAGMIDIIINGKSTMTPFGSMLSKEDIAQVADYVQTLRK